MRLCPHRPWTAALLAIAALAAACSGDPTPTPTSVPATPTAHEPTATPAPLPEGVLRVAVTGAAPHRDLHRLVSEWATLFGSGLGYGRLMRFEAGPGTAVPSLAVECDLCDAWRVVDATTYEFDVDSRARWQDAPDFTSRPVTAQDVEFSLERLREPGSPHAGLLDSVNEIVAASERTVRLLLHYPDPDLIVKLASPYAVVLAPESLVGVDSRTSRVVGSGPWRFDQLASGQVMLTAWDGYFRDGEPALQGIDFLPVPDLETGAALLGVGRADMAQVTEEQWAELSGQGFKSVVIPRQGRGLLFGINARRAPFDDPDLRRAVFAALDPQQALERTFGIGRAGVGVPLRDPSWDVGQEAMSSAFGRPDEAARLLALAGGAPDAVTLAVGNFGEMHVAHGELLAEQLRQAGFDVTTEVLSRGAYLDRVWQRRAFDLFVGPLPPTDTTNAFLLALLHSRGASNVTGAGDPALDLLIEEQSVELDPARRREQLVAIQEAALEGAWLFMPVISAERWAVSPRVLDPPQAMPAGAGDWWKYVRVASQAAGQAPAAP